MKSGDDLLKEELYDEWHRKQHGFKHTSDRLDPWYRTVLKLLPEDFRGKILEIGCGNGDFSILLAKKYPAAIIVGSDFSHAAIQAADGKIPTQLANVTFKVENAEHLSFGDSEFDLVISCETIEHVFDPQKMANEMYRIIKPGSRFILTTENYFNGLIISWLQTWIFKKPFNSGSGIQPHENFMIFYKTRAFFKYAGFKNIVTYSNHYQWLLLPGIAPSRLCTKEFNSIFLKRMFKPFGRHFTYTGIKSPLNPEMHRTDV
jgi:ubiquinone/menaquinone biosynthesis C-methylase UbiE